MGVMITDDATRKHLFQAPELVRDLVCTYVPHPWLSGLDFGTLEPVPSSFVSDEMRQFHSDVIWRVKAQGEWVYLYLLIEFQSRVDPHMALRVMTYLALLYQSLVRQNQGLAQHRLPPVLPLVLYNGEATWTAVMDMAQLIPELPEDLRVYTPSLRYVLVDEERHLPDQGADHALAHLMRFAHAREPGQQLEHLVRALKLVQNDAKLLEHVCAWVKAVAQQKEWLRAVEALGQVHRQGEFAMAFKWGIERWVEDKQEEWLQQGIEQGLHRGIGQGEGLLLQKLLSKRFGDLPPEMVQMIRSAEPKEIELWGERVLDAPSLQAVFRPAH